VAEGDVGVAGEGGAEVAAVVVEVGLLEDIGADGLAADDGFGVADVEDVDMRH
jgi:hypothetical protein